MEGLGSGAEDSSWGYGGYSTSTNPFFSTFAPTVAKEAVAANPNKLVTLGNTGGYYTYDNYLGPDGNGTPIYGQTPWQGFDASGRLTSSGVMKKDNPAQLALLALAAATGMYFGLPALMGSQAAGGAAAAGAGGGLFGDAGLMYAGADAAAAGSLGSLGAEAAAGAAAGGLGGTVSTGAGSFLPLGGATGAGSTASSAVGGGFFGGGVGNTLGSLGSTLLSPGSAMGGGGMWGNLLGGALSLGGSLMSANAAKSAANTSAQSQIEAARIAADAQRFRPVGVTTRFGQSGFSFDNAGNLTGAGYSLDPDTAALRDAMFSRAYNSGIYQGAQAEAAGSRLFGLGSQYLAANPQEVAQNWMTKQQSLLAPSRERALSGVRNNLFNTGRTGLSVGATGERPDGSAGLGAANPEMEAYYNSLAQQDAQLAAQADQFGRDQVTFGQGLFSGGLGLMTDAYNPMKTTLGLADTLEGLGRNSLALGSELGGRASSAGANVGKSLFEGMSNAALTQQKVNQYSPFGGFLTNMANNPQLLQGLGNGVSNSGIYNSWTGNGMGLWSNSLGTGSTWAGDQLYG